MDQQMLAGKVAMITGASYGMGSTMAEVFAEEGASVVLTARHQDQLDVVVNALKAKGYPAIGVVADTGSTEDTVRVFEGTIKAFGETARSCKARLSFHCAVTGVERNFHET